jgi:predicted esterase
MLKVTGAEKFAYVGQSQGCAQLLGFLNHYPEYAKQISFLGMIAPALHIKKPDNL